MVVASLFSSAAAGRNYPIGVTHGVLHVQELLTESKPGSRLGAPRPSAAPSPSVPGAEEDHLVARPCRIRNVLRSLRLRVARGPGPASAKAAGADRDGPPRRVPRRGRAPPSRRGASWAISCPAGR
ncbi:MAG: hypothetical protein M0C28_12545 [Candidatus Moduliflexus flocculans]|nr:hypothetical protein [Candidatus Moduliflexus flocculans]